MYYLFVCFNLPSTLSIHHPLQNVNSRTWICGAVLGPAVSLVHKTVPATQWAVRAVECMNEWCLNVTQLYVFLDSILKGSIFCFFCTSQYYWFSWGRAFQYKMSVTDLINGWKQGTKKDYVVLGEERRQRWIGQIVYMEFCPL